jgi:isoquinoline 1-oxidoreductase alpha subunit
MTTRITVNGRAHDVRAEADTPLLWLLRGELQLTGTKFGCGMALCGACTVHVDGKPVRGCVTPLAAIGAQPVTTIEGLAQDVVQCGYCQSGQVMAAAALLAANPRPDDAAIDAAMAGNLCRCGTYPRIRAAVHDAARRLAGA